MTVEIKDKAYLTVEEASALFNIGRNKLRSLIKEPEAKYILYVGTKVLINREDFEKYLKKAYSI